MRKKFLALAISAAIATTGIAALAGCSSSGSGSGNTIDLTLWGSSEQQTMLGEMVESFKQANPDKKYNIKLAVVSEADAYSNLKTDVSAGADVYAFANDQLVNLKKIGALAKIGGDKKTQVESNNDAGSVAASKIGDDLYAYPFSSDNGYFLYYDSSKITSTQAGTLEGILQACQASIYKFVFDLDNSWYVGAFFFGTGCDYGVTYDSSGTVVESVTCTFNDEVKGVAAGKAAISLANNSQFLNGDDTVIKAGFQDGSVAAAVTGTWNAADISSCLGENYAACKLPTFTVDGTTYQMGSFSGYKLYGVNPTSKNIGEAHNLAAFLTSEAMQTKRFETFGTGPSNTVAASKDAVKENIALSALIEQNKHARVQESVPANYWSALEAFGTDLVGGTITVDNLKEKLDVMAQSIKEST